jgi:hypothetical protein
VGFRIFNWGGRRCIPSAKREHFSRQLIYRMDSLLPMQDFLKVLLMLLLVLTGLLGFIVLSRWLGIWGLAILEILITTAIILLAIKFVRSRRP